VLKYFDVNVGYLELQRKYDGLLQDCEQLKVQLSVSDQLLIFIEFFK